MRRAALQTTVQAIELSPGAAYGRPNRLRQPNWQTPLLLLPTGCRSGCPWNPAGLVSVCSGVQWRVRPAPSLLPSLVDGERVPGRLMSCRLPSHSFCWIVVRSETCAPAAATASIITSTTNKRGLKQAQAAAKKICRHGARPSRQAEGPVLVQDVRPSAERRAVHGVAPWLQKVGQAAVPRAACPARRCRRPQGGAGERTGVVSALQEGGGRAGGAAICRCATARGRGQPQGP